MSGNYIPRLEEYNEMIHKKIHYGKYFSINSVGTITTGQSKKLHFKTPISKYLHLVLPNISISEGNALVKITKNPTVITDGDPITIGNHNGTSLIISEVQECHSGCTFSNDGIVLFQTYAFGGKSTSGNIFNIREEYILNLNTSYGLIITNLYNTSILYSHYQSWYETDEEYNELAKKDSYD